MRKLSDGAVTKVRMPQPIEMRPLLKSRSEFWLFFYRNKVTGLELLRSASKNLGFGVIADTSLP